MVSWRFVAGCMGKRAIMSFSMEKQISPFGLYVIKGDSLGTSTLDHLIKNQ